MPLPFILKNCPTTGTECVARNNFHPGEQKLNFREGQRWRRQHLAEQGVEFRFVHLHIFHVTQCRDSAHCQHNRLPATIKLQCSDFVFATLRQRAKGKRHWNGYGKRFEFP